MARFDSKTMYNFEKYLKLQKSGELNMLSPEVRERLEISKDEHYYIIEHYSELFEEYEESKKLDVVIEDAEARAKGEAEKADSKDFELENEEISK